MFYYVYAYVDPRTELPFYIGKGHGTRAYSHLTESRTTTKNLKKWNKIASLRKSGYEPQVTILIDNLTEDAAYLYEEELIRKYGRKGIDPGGILTNICASGRPPGCAYARIGKLHSEHSKKIMAARKAKTWILTKPNGSSEKIINLSAYCRQHGLYKQALIKIANGQQKKPYKGYSCKKLPS